MRFIDQGYCFMQANGRPDLPLMGTYEHDHVYRNITSWDSFEPVLSRIEAIDYADLWRFAAEVPQEWYQYDSDDICRLVETLYKRRAMVRDLITSFRFSIVNPFPKMGCARFISNSLKTGAHRHLSRTIAASLAAGNLSFNPLLPAQCFQ